MSKVDPETALEQARRLFDEALPKFNWGASALDANAISLLNTAPGMILRALEAAVEASSFRRIPFEVGNTYLTQDGRRVRVVEAKDTPGYESVLGDDGAWRYNRPNDMGRCTGTDHDFSHPGNFVPVYVRTALIGAAPPSHADTKALDAICQLLSGAEWGSNATDRIAGIVRGTGRVINDVGEGE